MQEFEYALYGYRLTTAEIIYHLPDFPDLLQTFLWQEYDHPPEFPKLHKFIDFWTHEIEGRIHSVRVGYKGPLMPNQVLAPSFYGVLH